MEQNNNFKKYCVFKFLDFLKNLVQVFNRSFQVKPPKKLQKISKQESKLQNLRTVTQPHPTYSPSFTLCPKDMSKLTATKCFVFFISARLFPAVNSIKAWHFAHCACITEIFAASLSREEKQWKKLMLKSFSLCCKNLFSTFICTIEWKMSGKELN